MYQKMFFFFQLSSDYFTFDYNLAPEVQLVFFFSLDLTVFFKFLLFINFHIYICQTLNCFWSYFKLFFILIFLLFVKTKLNYFYYLFFSIFLLEFYLPIFLLHYCYIMLDKTVVKSHDFNSTLQTHAETSTQRWCHQWRHRVVIATFFFVLV